jgi:hypothetical protein
VRNVVGRRGQWVLHGGGGQLCALQPLDHLRPGRAFGVGTVHQDRTWIAARRTAFARPGSRAGHAARIQVLAVRYGHEILLTRTCVTGSSEP